MEQIFSYPTFIKLSSKIVGQLAGTLAIAGEKLDAEYSSGLSSMILAEDPSFEVRPKIFYWSQLGVVEKVGDLRYNVYLKAVHLRQ